MTKFYNVYFALLFLMGNTACASQYQYPGEAAKEDFYNTYAQSAWEKSRDEDSSLIKNPDLTVYKCTNKIPEKERETLAHFRIYDERKDGKVYPGMTVEDENLLHNDRDFINDFTVYLHHLYEVEYFSDLNTRTINLSRGEPSEEYRFGKPHLDGSIRKKNEALIRNLNKKLEKRYTPLDNFMKHVSKTHQGKYNTWKKENN